MRKITPFLWFEKDAAEAAELYTSLLEEERALRPDLDFLAMDGGREPFSPAVSFFLQFATAEAIDRAWEKLADGGTVLMEIDRYPWSERYGWVQDRFGVSWQLMLTDRPQTIIPCLMYVGAQHGKAEEAMQLYISLFEDSSIESVMRYGEGEDTPGTVKHGVFRHASLQGYYGPLHGSNGSLHP